MATGIDKLTVSFNARPTFRQGDEKIELATRKDKLEVIGKDGQKKTIEGFQSASGTFFRLKEKNGQFHVVAYGTPDQLSKTHLKVRNGDLTKARFGDQRFDHIDPFKPKAFQLNGNDLTKADEFAKNFHLKRRDEDPIKQEQPPAQPQSKSQVKPADQEGPAQVNPEGKPSVLDWDEIRPPANPQGQAQLEQPREQPEVKPADQEGPAQVNPEGKPSVLDWDEIRPPANPQGQAQVNPEGDKGIGKAQDSGSAPVDLKNSAAKPVAQALAPFNPEAVIQAWEQKAAQMSAVQLVRHLEPAQLLHALGAGEITEKTYLEALQGKNLNSIELARWKNHSLKSLPDPATVTMDAQRARWVRHQVHVSLFSMLKPAQLSKLRWNGEITETAFRSILKAQLRDQKITDVNYSTTIRMAVPPEYEKQAQSRDLKTQLDARRKELAQLEAFDKESLNVLYSKRKSGELSNVAYDFILQRQKNAGLITDEEFKQFRTF